MRMRKMIGNSSVHFICLLLLLFLSGCVAGQASFSKGTQALEQQDYDQAVVDFLSAVESNPNNRQYRLNLNSARNKAALDHKLKGDELAGRQQYPEAIQEYQLAVELDGSMYAAADGLNKVRTHLQAERLVNEAETLLQTNRLSQAKDLVQQALKILPDFQPALMLTEKINQSQYALVDGVELEVKSTQPINLNFRETKLPDVFDILTRLSGINFILDEDVRSSKTTLFLEQATFAQALELLLRMNKLDKKILNKKTIILFPKTRDKQKQFEDQLIQTFYLSHIDAKKAVNLLRTMLQVRKIYVQEELNAIVIRDQPDVIRLAQKMLEANDRGNSEVVFDLELIEVNHSDTQELGIKLTNYSIGVGLSAEGTGNIVSSGLSPGASTDGLISTFKGLEPFYSIPSASFRFIKTLVNAEILASPKIRVRNNEKAKVHVGSREPVITTVAVSDTVTENVQYIDVGVKLEVAPLIQLDNTIVTKLGLEVSNVSGREKTTNGTSVVTISSTNADTTLTLKDGEQTIIGGLIRDDNSVTKNKIPLLGDIPLLGELFNGTDKNKTKREILLSITPHIVKSVHVPLGDSASIWSGGEDDLKFGRNFGTFADEYQTGQQGVEPQAVLPDTDNAEGKMPAQDLNTDQLNETMRTAPAAIEQTISSGPPANTEVMTDSVPEVLMPEQEPITGMFEPMIFAEGARLVSQGEELSVNFYVEEMEGLFSAPLSVRYDPTILEFVNAKEGWFLSKGEVSTVFSSRVQDGQGRIVIELQQTTGGQGASGYGELFGLHFKALAPGKTEISLEQANFLNAQGEALAVDVFGLSVEVSP